MELVSYAAVFTPTAKEIQVDFPDVPEAFTQGQTMDEAIENAKLGLAIVINDKLGHFDRRQKSPHLSRCKKHFLIMR